ncbi:MAG TPA: acetylornithine/succinylornithine family transaminase [Acidimicrobiales bacterium]|nr:acetylornithine/succinylornithine family transaminase [Acidimicrobiales bacterium]
MSSPLMSTYAPAPVTFVRGEGTRLFDESGKEYLDFLSGLAVTSLGHAHPKVTAAVAEQAATLSHVSNLFDNLLAPKLAATLDGLVGGGGQVFFTNSGAEANECAFKLARLVGGRGKHVVISAFGSFHGRTLATLHATGQPAKHEKFQPLPEGFVHAAAFDLADIERLVDATTAAVLIEVVQGEGGVHPAPEGFVRDLRALCDARGVLLIVDEVQTGLGRTGEWFGFQHAAVRPDIVTVAKALGNGMPIGACWARAEVAAVFEPGDHGSTYGGQPLACSAAQATLDALIAIDAPASARRSGARLADGLRATPGVEAVRGLGLLLGAELRGGDAKSVNRALLDAGLVANAVTETALRFAPPLNVREDEIDAALAILKEVLA